MARGFGTTDGAATTDILTTTYTGTASLMSWGGWVYLTGAGGSNQGRLFDKEQGTGTEGFRLMYDNVGAVFNFTYTWTGGTAQWTCPAPSTGAWHFWMLTYDNGATTNVPVFYLDFSVPSVSTVTGASGTPVPGTQVYTLGNRSGGARNLNGRLADIWTLEGTILTAANAKTLAGHESIFSVATPTNYWKLCGDLSPEPNSIVANSTATVTGTAKQDHPTISCTCQTLYRATA